MAPHGADARQMAHDVAFRIAQPALSFLEEEDLVDRLGVRGRLPHRLPGFST